MSSLHELEEQVRRDLELLDYPRREWVVEKRTTQGTPVLDCLIIGGGQGGVAVAWGLLREKVKNILVVDANPQGQEGPWRTFARMVTLRTPKYLTGPDGGVASLTIRAWYEAQHGAGTWDKLELIPKETWAAYLAWLRATLRLPVRNNARAGAIQWLPEEDCFAIPINGDGEVLYARTVVLATGIEGSGQWHTPSFVSENLPRHLYAHTHTEIGFPALAGKKVAVLGAGACAFDNAAVALENGASEVHLFFRRKELVRVNPYRWAEFTGFLKHHGDMPDEDKWKFIRQIIRMGQLPPANTYRRAVKHENFHLHAGTAPRRVSRWESNGSEGVRFHMDAGDFDADFLIVGTGFQTDLNTRTELAHLVQDIALWKDRYTPPEEQSSEELSRHPYLGGNFEFTEKAEGAAPHLARVFNYTFGCLLSLGFGGASISGMKYSLPRVVGGVTKQLYLQDKDYFFQTLCDYNVEDFEL